MIKLADFTIERNVMEPMKGALSNKLTAVGVLSRSGLKSLGGPDLVFDRSDVVTAPFDSATIGVKFADATVKHMHPNHTLEMNGCVVDQLAVHRVGGKKKPKKMLLSMRICYAGPPFDISDHLLKVGKAEGELTINAPEQQELDLKKGGAPKPDTPATERKRKPKTVPIRKVKR